MEIFWQVLQGKGEPSMSTVTDSAEEPLNNNLSNIKMDAFISETMAEQSVRVLQRLAHARAWSNTY